MIDVTVKTLDSQNHVFNVDEEINVLQFKETICPTVGIPVDQQRLIFRGRVLQNDKKISEYNVANNVIHVVQRPSNQNNSANDEPPRSSSQAGNRMNDGGVLFGNDDMGIGGRNAIIMGAINLPTIDIDGNGIEDIGGQSVPRRSGAAVRLRVGNQMLNRASALLQQLEDDEVVAASSASSSSEQNSLDNESSSNSDTLMDIDDESASFERMISQVVNVSSAAALMTAVRQVQPPSGAGPSAGNTQGTNNNSSNESSAAAAAPSESNSESGQARIDSRSSPARRPDSPRLREMATALQDLLALQDRLNPFLRFLQDALRENKLYADTADSQSTQFVFDTVSSIFHLLSHSLHAFSDIMCDFSITPEDRRLAASCSILVEQSTVVRATIPTAAMLSAAAAAGAGGNNNIPGVFSMTLNPTVIGGRQQSQPWRNPNIPSNNNTTPPPPPTSSTATPPPPPPPTNTNASSQGPSPNQIPGLNIQGGVAMLPPGLQNLGALLGMGSPGMVNFFGGGGPAGITPIVNTQSSNNNGGTQTQQQTFPQVSSGQPGTASNTSGRTTPRSQGQSGSSTGAENNNNNAGMFQNIQQMMRPQNQFDMLLPCHTHHANRSRSNRTRPTEFRRFVNVDMTEGSLPTNENSAEGEAVEIILDLITHSRIVDLLQPIVKDVALNYLMRGRDPKNDAHIKTCAKGLAKKILPFFETFNGKMVNQNESVDISATYTNVLTGFITSLLQKVLGLGPGGDGNFKLHIFTSFADLQKELIEVFKNCYPSSSNIGLLFVNYLVEHCLGGMSIVFKGHIRQKLVDYLKQVEKTCDDSNNSSSSKSSTVVVFKTVQPSSENETLVAASTSVSSSAVSSRCAASFGGNANSALGTDAASTPPKENKSLNTDDVDIDEVLQLPPSMAQSANAPAQQGPRRSGGSQGHSSNQTDSIVSLMRSLPSEWTDTVQQDIRRQVEMPSQPAFSPGYNTLFPRKK